MKGIRKDEYMIESEVFNLLEIDADLFTYETPFGMVVNEFKRLSSMENDLFTYELGVVEDFYFPCGEQQLDNSGNSDLDVYERKVCYDECEKIYVEAIRGDKEEVLTDEELFDLEEENLSEGDEIAEIFRIETDIFDFETPLCEAFKEINYLFKIDVDDEVESSDDAWSHYSPIDEWKDYEHTIYIETDVNSNYNSYLDVCQIFNNHAGTNNNDEIQENRECFDEHEPMEDNNDIGELDDYFIRNDASFIVDEEEERSKERRCANCLEYLT
ncbi:hypothetical protein Tco_1154230 [Tanacetum coccineum]